MIRKLAASGTALILALLGASATAQEQQPHYLVATISVSDFDTYMEDYASIAIPTILEAGGEILVASREAVSVEREASTNWTVVVRFPSEDAASRWYNSAAYQAIIPVRQRVTDGANTSLLFAPHFQPPSD